MCGPCGLILRPDLDPLRFGFLTCSVNRLTLTHLPGSATVRPTHKPVTIRLSLLASTVVLGTRPLPRDLLAGAGRQPIDERPVPDAHRGHIAIIAEDAQGSCIQQEMLTDPRAQPDPARSEHAHHVSMC